MKKSMTALWIVVALPAMGQPTEKRPAFEVASVKSNKTGSTYSSIDFSNGRVTITNVAMKTILMGAFNVRGEAILNAPGWTETDRFDILAKTSAAADEGTLRLMLQTLLGERFKLAIHYEEKKISVYALVVDKRSFKLRKSSPPKDEDEELCRSVDGEPGQRHVLCQHITMSDFVDRLPLMAPGYIDRPVVDFTGLKGLYEFRLDWMPAGRGRGVNGGRGRNITADSNRDQGVPPVIVTLPDTIESQMGMRLEDRKMATKAVAIDHIERTPAEN